MKKALLALLLLAASLANAGPIIWIPGSGGGGGSYSFTYVGSDYFADDGASVTSIATDATISVPSGGTVIVAVQFEDNGVVTSTVTSVTDGTNTYTAYTDIHNAGDQMNLWVFYTMNATAVANATFTASISAGAPYAKITAIVYSKTGGTTSLDISGTPDAVDDTNLNSAPTSGSFSTAGSSSLVCGIAGIYTGGSWSLLNIAGSAADNAEDNSGQAIWCDDNSTALSGVVASSSYTSLRYWVATAIAFKAE